MTAYGAAIVGTLSRDLCELLQDNDVQKEVAQWLSDRNIKQIAAFADLADNKQEIIDNVGRPAGLDPGDAVSCQPLRTAWRQAEARAKADIEAKAKGEDTDVDVKISPMARKRLDDEVKNHFKFTWPAALSPDDLLLGRLIRFYRKKTRYCPRLAEVRSLLEKGTSGRIVIAFEANGKQEWANMRGHREEEEMVQVHGVFQLMKRHMMAMVAYAQAASPEFAMADLSVLLDYHSWLQEKAFEMSAAERPSLDAIVEADFAMRTKWMLSYCAGEFPTLTAAIQHHRGHSAYLFTGLRTNKGTGKGGKLTNDKAGDKRRTPPPTPPPTKRRGGEQPTPQKDKRGQGRPEAARAGTYETTDPQTKKPLCTFYNKNSCNKGDKCNFIHKCNYPGCFQKHSRIVHHGA
mgnify:CR=1 FL=1